MMFLALNSGGIDSPVAAYLVLKKGYGIDFIYFDTGDERTGKKTRDVMKKLGKIFKMKFTLYVIPHPPMLDEFIEKTGRWDTKFICIFCKRMMYRIGEKIAERDGYDALITGENLGQVASQTLQNLSILEEAVTIPVLRPLLCMDKDETMNLAREIGTYEISIRESTPCPYVPKYPAINTRLEKIQEIEEKIDIDKMINNAVDLCETHVI
jgi:thiamine biosynthesis protein ThiI